MITQYNQQQNILPGQITVFRGVLYKAVKKQPNVPCVAQCDCRMPDWAGNSFGCSGLCYRWDNGDRIVFLYAEEDEITDGIAVETKYAESCRKQMEQSIRKQYGDQ